MTCHVVINPFTGRLDIVEGAGGSGAVPTTNILAKAIAAAVPAATKTTVVTVTAIVDTYITNVIGSGMEYGKWYLTVNSLDQAIRRGGSDRDVVWEFPNPLKIAAGAVLDVKVEHFVTGQTPDFEATVLGYT